MEEIEVIGGILQSDLIDGVEKVDGLVGGRSIEDNKDILREMGVSDARIDGADFYNHFASDERVDLLGWMGEEKIGIETKGVSKSKQSSKGNFKYWIKGVFHQMAAIDDTTDSNVVGVAIPATEADLFRETMSSYAQPIGDSRVRSTAPEELYGKRQTNLLRLYKDDVILLVGENGVEKRSCERFFGL